MKKFILPFFLLVSFLSSSQHLYKDLWNVMSFSEAKSELNEYFSYKYSKIKISSMHIGLGYPLILPFIVQCIIART